MSHISYKVPKSVRKAAGPGVLKYRHICLDGLAECEDLLLLKAPAVYDAIDAATEEFARFFSRITGFSLWTLQRTWVRRMLSGESFALIAPTGVGKSTVLQVYGLYRASGGEKVLYVVPTRTLVQQVTERLLTLGKSLGVEVTNDLDEARGGVQVVTHMLLFKRREKLRSSTFSTVMVDDFDALLKKSSLLDPILEALGFEQEDIELARKLVKLKQYAGALKHTNPTQYKETLEAIERLEMQLAESVKSKRLGQLLIASATGRGRRERVKVLRELLNFEVGSIVDYLRNVREFSSPLDSTNIVDLVRTLKRGVLIFVSRDLGRPYMKHTVEMLEEGGVKVEVARTAKSLEKLRRGEVEALVGVATYYGVLTRGIDEPRAIVSAIFVGVPKFTVPLAAYLTRTSNILLAYRALTGLAHRDEELGKAFNALSRLPRHRLKVIDMCLRGVLHPSGNHVEKLLEYASKLRDFVQESIKSRLTGISRLTIGDVVIRLSQGGIVVDIPDVYTYIQGSGRVSRLLGGHMTLGVTVLLYEGRDIYEAFLRRLRSLFGCDFESLNAESLARALDEAFRTRLSSGDQDVVVARIVPTLMIVESPTKARTISKIFGGGGRRYVGGIIVYETVIPVGQVYYVTTIVPCFGHVFDLAVDTGVYGVEVRSDSGSLKPVYTTLKRCRDCGHQYTEEGRFCPRCGSPRIYDSIRTIDVLRKLAKESSLVVIATDADEEGEKIAYDLYISLKPYNSNIKRAEFHEITRRGIVDGLTKLREVDLSLVRSQIIRRVDDRIVGFGISSVLKEHLGTPNVGGGRVQTPVLSWVVDRFVEYARSKSYVVMLVLPYDDLTLRVYVNSREEAERILSEVSRAGIEIVPCGREVEILNPKPPYTTDTALEEIGQQLRLRPGETMKILQELYELGFITYHRTSSTRVSSHGIEIAKAYLRSVGLESLFSPRGWGEGGAHEAIRPTRPVDDIETECIQMGVPLTRRHYEAYRMIFRRFLASQMVPAKVELAWYSFRLLGAELARLRLPRMIVDEGFTRVLPLKVYSLPDEISVAFPKAVKVYRGARVSLLTAAEVFRKMRSEGIGRPSTYAKAIENNRRHGYIVLSKHKQFLVPTKKGMAALDLIAKVYPSLTTPTYTAKLMRLAEGVDKVFPYELALLLPISTLAEIRINDLILKVSPSLTNPPQAQRNLATS